MKIDKENIRNFIEAIGLVSIVSSLIFVGLQLAQDRRVALGDQYASRAETAMAQLQSNLESDAYLETFSKRWEDGSRPSWWDENNRYTKGDSTARDVEVISLNYRHTLIGFDNLYFQYLQGLLSEEEWLVRRTALQDIMTRDPMRRAYWTDPELNSYSVLSVIQEIANEID